MPFHNLRGTIFGLVIVMTLPATAMAQSQATPSIDDLLRGMTDTLKSSAALTLHVEKLFDDVLATGEKLQYAGAIDVALRRPDRFHVSYGDDLSAMEAWYDGSLFVLVDLMAGVYGLLPSSDTIDTTLATVADPTVEAARIARGGLYYEMQARLGLVKDDQLRPMSRAFLVVLIAWGVPLIISVFEGTALGSFADMPFLLHLPVLSRFLLGIGLSKTFPVDFAIDGSVSDEGDGLLYISVGQRF